jgi:cell pole-organizing protein PopZ
MGGVHRARKYARPVPFRPADSPEDVMKNRHEEKAAQLQEALAPIGALIEELAATTPPALPRGRLRRERKMTPAVIRRNIAGLRSGAIRPADPAQDPNAVADALEAELELILGMERLGRVLEQTHGTIASMIDGVVSKALPDALEVYRTARELARTTGDEALKEHVRRMDRALGRGARR